MALVLPVLVAVVHLQCARRLCSAAAHTAGAVAAPGHTGTVGAECDVARAPEHGLPHAPAMPDRMRRTADTQSA
jgi:hypothetical protein